jgi:ubiquinone/menaquinone biosynthesis C-methylase UbiE
LKSREAASKRNWDDLAALDPLWAICSVPSRRYGRWDEGEFFRTGELEIEAVLAKATELGLPRRRRTALDFGCGVGRLTRALSHRFDTVYGFDISSEMITRAVELNSARPNCKFVTGSAENLGTFDARSFDFVYSRHVLQHLLSASDVLEAIGRLARIVSSAGLLVFDMPSHLVPRHRPQPKRRAYTALRSVGFRREFLYRKLGLNPMSTVAIPRERLEEHLAQSNCELVHVEPIEHLKWSFVYYVTPSGETP